MEEVTATDADSGVNAELVYRIQKGAFDDFAINETTGVVTVSRKLDYDEKNTYHVEVIAFDKGNVITTNDSQKKIDNQVKIECKCKQI